MTAELKFRDLRADEIEVRVGSFTKDKSKASYLLYKDARVDMRLLDEVVGPFGWQRTHTEVDGKVYCTVSIKSPDGEWVSKCDAGTESKTEAVKSEASDSFKRACFCWGLGRSLYTAPQIWVPLAENEQQYGARLHVSHIEYENGVITELELKDNHGNIRYDYGMGKVRREAEQPREKVKVITEKTLDNRAQCDKMLDFLAKGFSADPDGFTVLGYLKAHGYTWDNEATGERIKEIWLAEVALN